jgi:hypothetical protein
MPSGAPGQTHLRALPLTWSGPGVAPRRSVHMSFVGGCQGDPCPRPWPQYLSNRALS